MRMLVCLSTVWVLCLATIASAATDWDRPVSTAAEAESVVSFFERIAEESGFDVVFDEKLNRTATLSMRLDRVPLHLAMGYATRATHNFYVEQKPGVVVIAPDTRQKRQQYEPMSELSFSLKHADKRTMVTVWRSLLQAREISMGDEEETVQINDIPRTLALATMLVDRIDLVSAPTPDSPLRDLIWIGDDSRLSFGVPGDQVPQLKLDPSSHVSFASATATARSFYDQLSSQTGLQFYFDWNADLDREATLQSFVGMTPREALSEVTQALGQFYVAWSDDIARISLDTRGRRYAEQPVGIQVFYLEHADTKEVITEVRRQLQSRQIAEVPRLNAVIVRDLVENLRQARQIIASMDWPKD